MKVQVDQYYLDDNPYGIWYLSNVMYFVYLTEENGWKAAIDNLPLYGYKDSKLVQYRYKVSEAIGGDPDVSAEWGKNYGCEFSGDVLVDESQNSQRFYRSYYLEFKDNVSNVTLTNIPRSITIESSGRMRTHTVRTANSATSTWKFSGRAPARANSLTCSIQTCTTHARLPANRLRSRRKR